MRLSRRDDEDHRVGREDEPAEPLLPWLTGQDVLLIDIGLEPPCVERGDQTFSEIEIPTGIGDKYARPALAVAAARPAGPNLALATSPP